MSYSNLRFLKTFVFNSEDDELNVLVTTDPSELALYEVGIFNARTNLGITATPTNLTAPQIVVHQNLGDNKFGTTRSKVINLNQVTGWRAKHATVAVDQVSYIGYDEVVGTKTLTAYTGQDVEINITVFDNELTKWFGKAGYTERIVLDIASCAVCQADCELLDPDDIADFFVAYINGTLAPSGNFPVSLELSNWVTASKVATGTQGEASRRTGIKLVAKSHDPELLDPNNPQQFYKAQLTTFVAGIPYNCPNFPVTYTTKGKAGCGYPLEVQDLEKESQGYDRVRDQFEHNKYMKTNFIIRAQDGIKYDMYFLDFTSTHNDSGLPKTISDPYTIVFITPTDGGGTFETIMNLMLVPLGFAAVTIDD